VSVIAGPVSSAYLAVVVTLSLGPETIRAAHRTMLVAESGRCWLASAATAAMTGVIATALASSCSATELVVAVPLMVFALPAVVVDAHEQRLPDALTCPLMMSTSAIVVLVSAVDPMSGLRAAAATAAVTAGALLLKVISSDVIGWGDVKLLPSLAAALGWSGRDMVLAAVVLWVVLIATQSAISSTLGKRSPVPYGPALLAGVVGALVAG
jgi:leader peptidase (prepilin peptidase)/N-methyltransferase